MTLEEKYDMRNNAIRWLYLFVSPFWWIVVTILVSFCKFSNYGLAMYPGYSHIERISVPKACEIFLNESVWPMLWWAGAAIVADIFVIRPLYLKLTK